MQRQEIDVLIYYNIYFSMPLLDVFVEKVDEKECNYRDQ